MKVPFNKPYLTGRELGNIKSALDDRHLSGDGRFTKHCHEALAKLTGSPRPLLVHSCTAALEMSVLLAGIGPGDEVIMPSFTFVSTANAVVLREGVPVFVDIRPDTLNIDERLIEDAITERTRAVMVVHYAGVACEMTAIRALCERHGLVLLEDAAQCLGAYYRGRHLGSFGQSGALSFHATKNIVSGEGGALLVNDPALIQNAEIIREKGTNRSRFLRGEVDKYTWEMPGSSYLPADMIAAVLLAQLEAHQSINQMRRSIWSSYHEGFTGLDSALVQRPGNKNGDLPDGCDHNGHIYFLVCQRHQDRELLIEFLKERGVQATSHYVPLHSSPAGQKFCRSHGGMEVTDKVATGIVRLPIYAGLSPEAIAGTVESVNEFWEKA